MNKKTYSCGHEYTSNVYDFDIVLPLKCEMCQLIETDKIPDTKKLIIEAVK